MADSKFDDILTTLGTGRWNMIFFLADCLTQFVGPPQFLSGVYLAPYVEHTCLPPAESNATGISEDSCRYYINRTTTSDREDEMMVVTESFPCTQWEYNNSIYSSTLTSEFDLVCGRAYLRATYQSMTVIASMLSSSLIGYLSDRYGRKTLIVITQICHSIIAISIAAAKDIYVILALRFIQGCFPMNIVYGLALEVCELKRRSVVGILIGLPWAFGIMAFGGTAYMIRDWRLLQLAVSVPLFSRIIFHFFIDESPRWLIIKGKHDRALAILQKASRLNKAELPPESQLRETFNKIQKEQGNSVKKKAAAGLQETRKRTRLTDYLPKLIRTPQVRLRTIILSTILFTNDFVYTGLTMSADAYSSDPFLYHVLGGLSEVPAYTLAAPIISRFGRKKPAILWFSLSGIALLALAFIPSDISWLIMTLALLGKLSITMAFMVLFVYLNELFPTEVRMQGVGVTAAVACIGITIAPYFTAFLIPIMPWVPSFIFGLMSLLAGALFYPLPETLDQPMSETVEALEGSNPKNGKDRDPNDTNEELKSLNDDGC